MKTKLLLFFLLTSTYCVSQVGIGAIPNPSSALDVFSIDKGVLLPRVSLQSTTDTTTITNGNVESMLVFNTSSLNDVVPGYYYWLNNKWNLIRNDEKLTSLLDNTNGTLTYNDENNIANVLDLKYLEPWHNTATNTGSINVNDIIYHMGNVGIKTTNPTNELDVNGQARVRVLNSGDAINDQFIVTNSDGVLHKITRSEVTQTFHVRKISDEPFTYINDTDIRRVELTEVVSTTSNYQWLNNNTLKVLSSGLYLVTVQGGSILTDSSEHIIGIVNTNNNWIGRATWFAQYLSGLATKTYNTYTTILSLNANQEIGLGYFCDDYNCTIQGFQTGTTGTGSITNLTVVKLN